MQIVYELMKVILNEETRTTERLNLGVYKTKALAIKAKHIVEDNTIDFQKYDLHIVEREVLEEIK